VLIPGGLVVCKCGFSIYPNLLSLWQRNERDVQKSAEAIVLVATRPLIGSLPPPRSSLLLGRAEHVRHKELRGVSFCAMRQKSIQLALTLEGTGEALPDLGGGIEAQAASPRPVALAHGLMEVVVSAQNMRRALKKVRSNKGSPGVDGMTVSDLGRHLVDAWPALREELLAGEYKPDAIRRVDIPKPDGGTRQLGIPTVVDRLVQQALLQVLKKK